jgi:alkyldihydroxyacetonephosphate synthase
MTDSVIKQLENAIGSQHVQCGEAERVAYSTDMWPRAQIWRLSEDVQRYAPQAVVWPGSVDDIVAIAAIAQEAGMPVIPYGAGSGVCGGTVPLRGGIIVDVKRMREVVAVNETDLTVTAQTGINGMHLEDELNARGYTLGHFPSSIMCSTLGGWLAARSAGQYSSRYGKIEDMVVGLRAVTVDGQLMETGPLQPFDWTQVLVGSEGTLATLTEATLRIHPMPRAQAFRSYRFRSVEAGVHGIRQVMQAGLKPHLVRLYDPFDSVLHSTSSSEGGIGPSILSPIREFLSGRSIPLASRGPKMALAAALSYPSVLNRLVESLPVSCLLIVGFTGTQEETDEQLQRARNIFEDAGGVDGGEAPGLHWYRNRYGVSFKQSSVFDAGAFVDTMEVSCIWSRLLRTYNEVRDALTPHVALMAHFSHAYREGCSIYFTFAGYRRDSGALERLYDLVWSDGMSAVLRAGASFSHHHGVGYAKRDAMGREHGAGIRVLYAVKDAFDPNDLMNPGKVLPDRAVLE